MSKDINEKPQEEVKGLEISEDSLIQYGHDFTAPDLLAPDAKFELDPNRDYLWRRKDRLYRDMGRLGYREEEGHTEHFDLKLVSRPKEIAERESLQNEYMCQKREKGIDPGLSRLSQELQSDYGYGSDRSIIKDLSRTLNGPRHRAGQQRENKKFYSFPS